MPAGTPQVIVSGLPLSGDHPMHPFVIDPKGHLYVDLGSATNSCQARNRVARSPGLSPCTELETRAGTWRYDANRTGQHFSPAERFATGIRNGEGFAFDQVGRLYVMQHGRDQLAENWPDLYRPEQGANQPAEELLQLDEGADYGWPECYFDGDRRKLVLAPEYGSDGGKAVGPCAQKRGPVAWFPAHWAPNDLMIYNGVQFPDAYQGGAFIAFHGSWNRAPFPQEGYNVVFQPLNDGKPSGPFVVFADGFAGSVKEPGQAAHRPSGLAVGPDGALYITDDVRGRIWRVTFHGNTTTTGIAPAPAPRTSGPAASNVQPPEGLNAEAGEEAAVAALPVPEGITRDELKLGSCFPRPRGRCHLRRLPRIERKGHAARPRPHQRPVAMGRRQPGRHQAHDRGGRRGAEGVQKPDAADGRPAAVEAGPRCSGRLRVGARAPGWAWAEIARLAIAAGSNKIKFGVLMEHLRPKPRIADGVRDVECLPAALGVGTGHQRTHRWPDPPHRGQSDQPTGHGTLSIHHAQRARGGRAQRGRQGRS
jgi:glucose/arabinose dehydrogenase